MCIVVCEGIGDDDVGWLEYGIVIGIYVGYVGGFFVGVVEFDV